MELGFEKTGGLSKLPDLGLVYCCLRVSRQANSERTDGARRVNGKIVGFLSFILCTKGEKNAAVTLFPE